LALLGFVLGDAADRLLEPTLALAPAVTFPALAAFLVPAFALAPLDAVVALGFAAELRALRPGVVLLPARLDVFPVTARGLPGLLRVAVVLAEVAVRLVAVRADFWPLDLGVRFGLEVLRTLLAPAGLPRGGDAFPVLAPATLRPEVVPLAVLSLSSLGVLAMRIPHMKRTSLGWHKFMTPKPLHGFRGVSLPGSVEPSSSGGWGLSRARQHGTPEQRRPSRGAGKVRGRRWIADDSGAGPGTGRARL
jgi:hypothetical protein